MGILLATDGKPHSEKALKSAIEIARCRSTKLFVIHIVMPKRGVDIEKTVKEGVLALDTIKKRGEAMGVQVTTILESGSPYNEIINAANDNGVDMIIVGSSGKNRVEGFLVGSVSEYVVHTAQCSVLVVK